VAAVNSDLEWRNSLSGPGFGGAVGLPHHDVESSFTAVAATGTTFLEDTALGGSNGDHDGKVLIVLDGNAELFAARIETYRTGVGFQLDTATPSQVEIGDEYRVYAANIGGLQVDAIESAEGRTTHRGWYLRNNSGETIDRVYFWIKPLNPTEFLSYEIFADDGTTTLPAGWDGVAGPTQANLDTLDPDNEYSNPSTPARGRYNQPRQQDGDNLTLTNGLSKGLYIRQKVTPNAPPHTATYLLVFQGEDTVNNTITVAIPILVEIAGYTPDITLSYDRRVQVGGGARINAVLRAQETGALVPDQEIAFTLATGPGSLSVPDEGVVTDDLGEAFVSYVAPTDQGDAGSTIEVEARI